MPALMLQNRCRMSRNRIASSSLNGDTDTKGIPRSHQRCVRWLSVRDFTAMSAASSILYKKSPFPSQPWASFSWSLTYTPASDFAQRVGSSSLFSSVWIWVQYVESYWILSLRQVMQASPMTNDLTNASNEMFMPHRQLVCWNLCLGLTFLVVITQLPESANRNAMKLTLVSSVKSPWCTPVQSITTHPWASVAQT